MMKTYDLYGIVGDSLEESRRVVEAALGIHMQAHESGFRGGDYYRLNDVGAEHFVLQCNYDPVEGEWAEPDHKGAPFVLYVNETDRTEEIQGLFAQNPAVSLLRHETV